MAEAEYWRFTVARDSKEKYIGNSLRMQTVTLPGKIDDRDPRGPCNGVMRLRTLLLRTLLLLFLAGSVRTAWFGALG
jgi:hypothetical protein